MTTKQQTAGTQAPDQTEHEDQLATLFLDFADLEQLENGSGAANLNCEFCQSDPAEQDYRNFCLTCSTHHCNSHLVGHLIDRHPYHLQTEEAKNRFLQELIESGTWLSSYADQDWIITAQRVVPNRSKSTWFLECAEQGYRRSCILQLQPPRDADEESYFTAAVRQLLDDLRISAHMWTPSYKLTLFCSEPLPTPYLPTDPELQERSPSGYSFDPTAAPGKIGKSLRVEKPAEGAFNGPASRWPRLRLPGGDHLKLAARDTNGAGDGQGKIKESAAIRLLEAAGAPLRRDTHAIQGVFTGADFTFKGLFIVIPNAEWTEPEDHAEFIVDSENFNTRLHNRRRTVVKVWAKAHKPNKRWFPLDVLNLQEAVIARFDPAELAAVELKQAHHSAGRDFDAALERQRTQAVRQDYLETTWRDLQLDNAHRELALREQRERADLELDIAGNSPWSSGFAMEYMAGSTWKNWSARRAKNTPLPMCWLSGERVHAMHPPYANQSSPKPGYARIVYYAKDEAEITGVGMHPKDVARFNQNLDTFDFDGDELTLTFYLKDGVPGVLILRSPASVDSGVELRLNQNDYRKLTGLGYHFYHYVGGPKFPRIHEKDDQGNPLHDYVLQATPHQEPIVWSNDPDEAMQMMLQMTRHRGAMGIACNLMHILDRSGLWNPDRHHFNFSESVIDPTLAGDKNPFDVIEPMLADLHQAVLAGKPICKCIAKRAEKQLLPYHKKQRERDPSLPSFLEMIRGCPESHPILESGAKAAVDWLQKDLNRKKLMANGPTSRLLAPLPQRDLDRTARAYEGRHRLWADHLAGEKEFAAADREQRDLYRQLLETGTGPAEQLKADLAEFEIRCRSRRDKALAATKLAERDLILDAYADCADNLEFAAGDFITAWCQLAMTDQRHFDKPGEPVRTAALSCLPLDEHRAYFADTISQPSALLRVKTPESLQTDQTYRVEATMQTGKTGKVRATFALLDQDGNKVSDLYAEARPFPGLELAYLGVMPGLAPADPGKYQGRTTQVFQALNPSAIKSLPLPAETGE